MKYLDPKADLTFKKVFGEHPDLVISLLNALLPFETEDEKIVGVLHDVVEDTEWTFEQLADEGFPPHIVDALRCVTKLSEEEPYDEFIERVKSNPLATAVKINDLTDNMDVRRYRELTDWDVRRLRKYLSAYRYLTGMDRGNGKDI